MPARSGRTRFLGEDAIEVRVSGQRFEGWESVRVEASMDQAARAWSVEVAAARAWPIQIGSPVVVAIGDDAVVTGHAEALESFRSGRSSEKQVAGRGLLGDLVDCSHEVEGSELHDVTVSDVVEAVVEPFGVLLAGPVPETERFSVFDLRPGESPWLAIDRAVRARGLLAWEDGEGRIHVGEPASARAAVALADGERGNVLESRLRFDRTRRFQTYRVVGQRAGTDEEHGLEVTEAVGSALDLDVERYRPLTIVADVPVDGDQAEVLAQSEAAFRAAQSERLEVVVEGWRQVSGGPIWEPNLLVPARISAHGLDAEYLVQRVGYERSGAGTRTRLELVRPDAYLSRPELPAADAFREFVGEDEEL